MTITNKNNHKSNRNRKGFHHGKASAPDQIAIGAGQGGVGGRRQGPWAILASVLASRFHPGADLRDPRPATILWDRLSRDSRLACGLIGSAKSSFSKQAATLHHIAEGPAKAFKKNIFQRLLAKIFDRAKAVGLNNKARSHAAIDSTGLENHFVSRHFIMRQKGRTKRYRRWTKLTIVCENASHLVAAASVGTGPGTDCRYLPEAVRMAVDNVPIETLLADSGYDSEYNHQLCRNELGIADTVIAVNERNRKDGPMTGRFRKLMKRHFPRKKYRQRWQVESVFSRFKRRLGYALRARTDRSRETECLLRVLTYNLMVVLFTFQKELFTKLFYRAFLKMKNWAWRWST
jgi:hypothetical protein